MRLLPVITISCLLLPLSFLGCAQQRSEQINSRWITLLDGSGGLENWNRVGDANWRLENGVVVADKGNGFLVSKNSYADLQIRAEFWADADVNSGILIRLADPEVITPTNSYEVNIYDNRPDPSYGTGAIVNVAKVSPMPKAAGRWNIYEITAKGPHLIVVLNGSKTVDTNDSTFARGPVALQYFEGAGGAIKWRKVQVRSL